MATLQKCRLAIMTSVGKDTIRQTEKIASV